MGSCQSGFSRREKLCVDKKSIEVGQLFSLETSSNGFNNLNFFANWNFLMITGHRPKIYFLKYILSLRPVITWNLKIPSSNGFNNLNFFANWNFLMITGHRPKIYFLKYILSL